MALSKVVAADNLSGNIVGGWDSHRAPLYFL